MRSTGILPVMDRAMGHELGIIGAGNMAEAIARSVLGKGMLRKEQLIAADVSPARRELFSRELGVSAVEENVAAARDAKMVLLSVKPQQMKDVLAGIGAVMGAQTLVISIAAGISSGFIEKHLGGGKAWRVIRAMPNTPMLVGQGMVALARGKDASETDLAAARRIFEAGAAVLELGEEKMDAVTAMSGSGPAYFFYLVEKMTEAGISLGLTPQEAQVLAVRTCIGAGAMLAGSSETPRELRRKVTSPGGTTQAAIETLESRQAGEAIVAAIRRAAERGRELGA
jgi:pyrroline-5-carboxylate reductase